MKGYASDRTLPSVLILLEAELFELDRRHGPNWPLLFLSMTADERAETIERLDVLTTRLGTLSGIFLEIHRSEAIKKEEANAR